MTSRTKITPEIIARRKAIHQYIKSQKEPVICMAIAKATGIPSPLVGADLRMLLSHDLVKSVGMVSVHYSKHTRGSTLVEAYMAGDVDDESLYARRLRMDRAKSNKPTNLLPVAISSSDEPEGRWAVDEVSPGHTVYRPGRDLVIKGGQGGYDNDRRWKSPLAW